MLKNEKKMERYKKKKEKGIKRVFMTLKIVL
jgi:hypothetical protein